MFRGIIIFDGPQGTSALGYEYINKSAGTYTYQFETVEKAKASIDFYLNNRAVHLKNVGFTVYILDETTSQIVEHSRLPKVPLLEWVRNICR